MFMLEQREHFIESLSLISNMVAMANWYKPGKYKHLFFVCNWVCVIHQTKNTAVKVKNTNCIFNLYNTIN